MAPATNTSIAQRPGEVKLFDADDVVRAVRSYLNDNGYTSVQNPILLSKLGLQHVVKESMVGANDVRLSQILKLKPEMFGFRGQAATTAVYLISFEEGEMHADTAATISSMGTSYAEKGQYDRAIELYERALRIQEATLGEMHAETAATICSMGTLYNKKGQYDRAIELFERALRIYHQALGLHHPETQQTEQSLAIIRSAAGRQIT